jgi:hypothetical protein
VLLLSAGALVLNAQVAQRPPKFGPGIPPKGTTFSAKQLQRLRAPNHNKRQRTPTREPLGLRERRRSLFATQPNRPTREPLGLRERKRGLFATQPNRPTREPLGLRERKRGLFATPQSRPTREPLGLRVQKRSLFATAQRSPTREPLGLRDPKKQYRKSVGSACLAGSQVRFSRNLDAACYAVQRPPRRRSLENKCYAQLRMSHRSLDRVCSNRPYVIHHRDVQTKCYPTMLIRHRSLDAYTCGGVTIKHRSPEQMSCATPENRDLSPLQKFAMKVKYHLSNNRRHCKITALYSGISAGEIVETNDNGTGVVVDYKIGRYATTFVRYNGKDSTKVKIERKYVPGIRRLFVMVVKDPNHPRDLNGMPLMRKVQLSEGETKALMLQSLVRRRRLEWLVRMYPEERQNLQELLEKYAVKRPDSDPVNASGRE